MTARLRRCPACRLAGRDGRTLHMSTRERPDAPFGVWVACRQCLCAGPIDNTEANAVAAWNDLSRAVKRGMRAKRGGRAAEPFRVERAFQPWGSEAAPDFVEGTRHPWPSPRGDER